MTPNTGRQHDARYLQNIVAVILAIIAIILLLQGGANYGKGTTALTGDTNIVVDLPQVDKSGAFTISGQAAPGARLQLVANGVSLGEVTAGADGRWQLAGDFAGSLKDSLKAGTYDLVARRTDAGGGGVPSPQVKLTVPDLSAAASVAAAAPTTAPAVHRRQLTRGAHRSALQPRHRPGLQRQPRSTEAQPRPTRHRERLAMPTVEPLQHQLRRRSSRAC